MIDVYLNDWLLLWEKTIDDEFLTNLNHVEVVSSIETKLNNNKYIYEPKLASNNSSNFENESKLQSLMQRQKSLTLSLHTENIVLLLELMSNLEALYHTSIN